MRHYSFVRCPRLLSATAGRDWLVTGATRAAIVLVPVTKSITPIPPESQVG
ncbi:MAG: hypothetical protein PVSMB4_17770 [Ktedonobacterales bacterium]